MNDKLMMLGIIVFIFIIAYLIVQNFKREKEQAVMEAIKKYGDEE